MGEPGRLERLLAAAEPPARTGETALHALQAFLAAQREVVLAREPGVLAGGDPEALHDFRVAVRRTRSGLGQVRRVLPPSLLEPLRAELVWLGAATGPPRDLDVLREALAGYLAPLPAWVRAGFAPVAAWVDERCAAARERLGTALGSARYRELLAAWKAAAEPSLAAACGPALPQNAQRPVALVAARRTRKAARRVARQVRALDAAPSPAALHALRIACKKLRYLLELFRDLAPAPEIAAVLSRLKRLQDLLGTANDLAVQEVELRRWLAERAPAPQATLALGYLLAVLDGRRAGCLEALREALAEEVPVGRPGEIARLFSREEAR